MRVLCSALPLEGHLRQRCMLIRGQNNIDVWGHDADRMAVSLGDEAPFKIDIVQPKAPLVAGVADELRRGGVAVFGPSATAAQIEGKPALGDLATEHGVALLQFVQLGRQFALRNEFQEELQALLVG